MSKRMDFTREEFSLALAIVAELDPDNYEHTVAQAVVLKCKAYQEDDDVKGWTIR